jgi:hypothetical protein
VRLDSSTSVLGAGARLFRAAEDNDLGYRLLEAGYRVLVVVPEDTQGCDGPDAVESDQPAVVAAAALPPRHDPPLLQRREAISV